MAAFARGLPDRRFRFTGGGAGPVIVCADPAALEQALANLLDNAVKCSEADTEVVVRTFADLRTATMEVVDRGAGIDPADQARVFDRFYRGTAGTCRPGFRLGLTIVRDLIQARGVVELQSVRGIGTTFRIRLPRSRPNGRRRAPTSGRTSHDSRGGASRSVRHVMVIEDEPQMRSMLIDNLEFEGYKVTAVSSGEEALSAFARDAFALLLVDVMLPGMSGFDVCQRLRERGAGVPIIVLTARAHERDRVRGLDLGADDYVSKPFSVRELLARVRASAP
ncbi:MAG: response regulator [Vicinamibacterales bacterium]